jgi:hypothetical protein
MQNLIRRWFGGAHGSAGDSVAPVRAWAKAEGHRFAPGRGNEGFVIEPANGTWRAEWGPSQRDYIEGSELRVRAELGADGNLQMLLIGRALFAQLERDVFEQFTEGNETRIDDRTPEEMRWLVLYPQVPRSLMAEGVRDRFAVLANRPAAAPLWLDGALATQLASSSAWHDDAQPLAMVVQRGRFVLRLAHPQPQLAVVQAAIALAGIAAAAARRVGAEVARGGFSSQRPSGWGSASSAARER